MDVSLQELIVEFGDLLYQVSTFVYVYMYVYVYVYMCMCLCVCVHVCVHVFVCSYKYVYTYVYLYACTYDVCGCVYMWSYSTVSHVPTLIPGIVPCFGAKGCHKAGEGEAAVCVLQSCVAGTESRPWAS